jgi:hypothetical protein
MYLPDLNLLNSSSWGIIAGEDKYNYLAKQRFSEVNYSAGMTP